MNIVITADQYKQYTSYLFFSVLPFFFLGGSGPRNQLVPINYADKKKGPPGSLVLHGNFGRIIFFLVPNPNSLSFISVWDQNFTPWDPQFF